MKVSTGRARRLTGVNQSPATMLLALVRLAIIGPALPFVIFYLVKADIFLRLRQILPIPPTVLFVSFSLPLIVLASLLMVREKTFAPLVYRCASVIIPFLALVVVALFGVLVRMAAHPSNDIQLFLPVFDFYVFLVGIVLAGLVGNGVVWRVSALVGLVITVTTIFIDVAHPSTFTAPELTGPSGLGGNPNIGAYTAALLLTATLNWRKRRVSLADNLIVLVTLAAILSTASRSGILLSIVVVSLYFYRARASIRVRSVIALGLFGLIGIAASGAWLSSTIASLTMFADESSKLSQLFTLSSETATFRDSAAQERIEAVQNSLALIEESPLLGFGTSFSLDMPVGPHDMYFARWVDNGIIGFVVFLWLLAAMAISNVRCRNAQGFVLVVIMVVGGLFSHNLLEDRTWLLLSAISTATAVIVEDRD